MKKIIKKEANHLTRNHQKQFVERVLREAGFPKGKKAFTKDRNGKLVVRFNKNQHDYY